MSYAFERRLLQIIRHAHACISFENMSLISSFVIRIVPCFIRYVIISMAHTWIMYMIFRQTQDVIHPLATTEGHVYQCLVRTKVLTIAHAPME